MRYFLFLLAAIVFCSSDAFAWMDPWGASKQQKEAPSAKNVPFGKRGDIFSNQKDIFKNVPEQGKKGQANQGEMPEVTPNQGRRDPGVMIYDKKTGKPVNPSNISVPEQLTPFGLHKGQYFVFARFALQSMFMKSGGRCQDGEVFFADPKNGCMAILVRGQAELAGRPDEKVTGASVWLSKQCMKDDPHYVAVKDVLASSGAKEQLDGWLLGSPIGACVQPQGKFSNKEIPPFLGRIGMGLDAGMANAMLSVMGKRVKEFSNGYQYDFEGNPVYLEFCPETKRIVSLSIEVRKRTEKLKNILAKMGIKRDRIEFEDVTIESARDKNGDIDRLQMYNRTADAMCQRGKT